MLLGLPGLETLLGILPAAAPAALSALGAGGAAAGGAAAGGGLGAALIRLIVTGKP